MRTLSSRRGLAVTGIAAVVAARSLRHSPWFTTPLRGVVRHGIKALARWIDHRRPWHRVPVPLGVLLLIGLREALRDDNFFPTVEPEQQRAEAGAAPSSERQRRVRTADGSFNVLDSPLTGKAGTRFARNFDPEHTRPEPESMLLTPNPRTVSRVLLTRDTFIPAPNVNLLAAAWLQFMIHGWFSHGKNQKSNPCKIPLAADDDWPERPMTMLRSAPDPSYTPSSNRPPTFVNQTSHWWDASQIYGDDDACVAKLRAGEGGRLRMGEDGLLPIDPDTGLDDEYGVNVTGVAGNWWIGLSLLHTLFTREHNAICDALQSAYPSWSDDDVFDHARLINSALMVKIFMVDWAPVITAHPVAAYVPRAAWYGLAGERIHRRFGRISSNPLISGVPGSPTRRDAHRYAITEELVAIYRNHAFLPDTFSFRRAADDGDLCEVDFPDAAFRKSRALEEAIPMRDLFYSFCTMNAGALTLHNFPRFLQRLAEPDGTTVDLAATDIFRTRERGVPRYNEYRRLTRLGPVRSFEELCPNPVWREELRNVYGDVDAVDLVVGLYAEPPPPGMAIPDSSYRLFILMTSIRLEQDRFLSQDYRPEIYSLEGLAWIERNDMRSVLSRHYPELAPYLPRSRSPFTPWQRSAPAG